MTTSVMSCLNALHWQITTLFSVPQDLLLLRHKVFREYAKIAVGPDFIHTLPSILILTAAIIILWKHPPSSGRFLHLLNATFVYRAFQVSVSWLAINALLWLWLILQSVLYCTVWHYWSYETEHRQILHRAWWQRLWSSYHPVRVQPSAVSTEFISWIIAMSITITVLGFAVYVDRVATFTKKILIKVRDVLVAAVCYVKRPRERQNMPSLEAQNTQDVSIEANMAMESSESGSIPDDTPSEMSVDMNGSALADVHPTPYRTNWVPQPNFGMLKEPYRKISMKSFHTVAGVNDIQDSDKIAAKQARHRRGCHTIIPSNSSEQSSEH